MKVPKTRDFQLQQFGRLGSSPGQAGNMPTESQEYIVESKNPYGMQISKDVTFTVRRESGSDGEDLPDPETKHADTPHTRYGTNVSAV